MTEEDLGRCLEASGTLQGAFFLGLINLLSFSLSFSLYVVKGKRLKTLSPVGLSLGGAKRSGLLLQKGRGQQ